jgi:hypothetical protein
MTITEIEKEIIKALKIEEERLGLSEIGYRNLITFVRKLFKEYKND